MVEPAPILFLMGPTASGKTDLAVALSERLPCDIISVDSAMIYRGMDIGTAKPDPALLARAPHQLIDICDAADSWSAGAFREAALDAIDRARQRGRIALLVGGTMLYFNALEKGLSPLPQGDPELRARLDREVRESGLEALYQRLRQLDPVSAQRIRPGDSQRIQRALEVWELTGEPLSALQGRAPERPLPGRPLKLALAPADRAVLHRRIAERFGAMLEQGLVAEVEGFHRRPDIHAELPSMRCVGYRQVWQYLENTIDYEAMRERGIIATRQLAKRQFTWLRAMDEVHWLDAQQTNILDATVDILRQRNYVT